MKSIYFLLTLAASALASSQVPCPCQAQDCSKAADKCVCENQNIVNKYFCCERNTAPPQDLGLTECTPGQSSSLKIHGLDICGGPDLLQCGAQDQCQPIRGNWAKEKTAWGLCSPRKDLLSFTSQATTSTAASIVSVSSSISSTSTSTPSVPVSTSTAAVTSTLTTSSSTSSPSVPVSTSTVITTTTSTPSSTQVIVTEFVTVTSTTSRTRITVTASTPVIVSELVTVTSTLKSKTPVTPSTLVTVTSTQKSKTVVIETSTLKSTTPVAPSTLVIVTKSVTFTSAKPSSTAPDRVTETVTVTQTVTPLISPLVDAHPFVVDPTGQAQDPDDIIGHKRRPPVKDDGDDIHV